MTAIDSEPPPLGGLLILTATAEVVRGSPEPEPEPEPESDELEEQQ